MSELLKKYPFLKDTTGYVYDPDPEDGTWLYSVPQGWRALFMKMCDNIVATCKQFYVHPQNIVFDQVKEKFGTLRVYWHLVGLPSKRLRVQLSDIISKAEDDSANICHKCGEPATHQSLGWVLPWCHSCALENHKAASERHKQPYIFEETFIERKNKNA